MGEVVTMAGHKLMTVEQLLRDLLDRDDLLSVAVVFTRTDGKAEVWFSQQEMRDVALKASQLNYVAMGIAEDAIDAEA